MNFDNCEAFVIPFSFDKASAWKQVLCYLSEDKTTPVEVVYHSHAISIDREYYPVEYLEINYTAKWNAISIFIERWTEKETHYEPQIHYFDRWGMEHERPGFDYWDTKDRKWKSGAFHPLKSKMMGYSGEAGTRPWQPQEVSVAVTENIPYERETGRERKFGEIKNQHVYYHGKEYPFSVLRTDKNEKVPYSDEAINGGKVINQVDPINKSIFDSELSKARANAKKLCIEKIPGQEYTDFSMDFDFEANYQILYYPVYHIVYEFLGQNYECFVSGYRKNEIKVEFLPEDPSIKSEMQPYDNQLSNLESQKKDWKSNYFGIRLGIVGVCFLGFFLFIGLLQFLLAFLLLVGSIALFIYLSRIKNEKIKELDQKIAKCNEAKNNIIPARQAKKETLLNVLLDDSLSESEKSAKCEKILNGGSESYHVP